MEQLGMKVPEEHLEAVEAFAEENDISKSQAGRKLLERGIENKGSQDEIERLQNEYGRKLDEIEDNHQEKVEGLLEEHHQEKESIREEYENRINELETEVNRVKSDYRQILDLRDEHNELVATVERERSNQERKDQANWFTRQKWRIAGMPE